MFKKEYNRLWQQCDENKLRKWPAGQLASRPTSHRRVPVAVWSTGQLDGRPTGQLANRPTGQPANWPDGQLANQASYFRPDPTAFSLHFAPLRLPTPGNSKIPPTGKLGGDSRDMVLIRAKHNRGGRSRRPLFSVMPTILS